MKEYRYVSSQEDLKENDYDMLKDYVSRPTHIMTEVNDSTMVFEDGTKGPFGQFKSFYIYDDFHYMIHESASCCPNSNMTIIEKGALELLQTMSHEFRPSGVSARCSFKLIDDNWKITDNIINQTIVIDKNTINEFIKKIQNIMTEKENPLDDLVNKIKESSDKMRESLDSFQESLLNKVLPVLAENKKIPKRGFQIVKDEHRKFPGVVIELPMRSTLHSAGYDLYSNEDYELKPMERYVFWTDVKVFMQEGEVFKVYVRSSLGFKFGVQIANSVGIIDSDYFSNPDNDGIIGVCLINLSNNTVKISKGDRIAQGIFEMFLEAEDGYQSKEETRKGGIGSTNEETNPKEGTTITDWLNQYGNPEIEKMIEKLWTGENPTEKI